MICVVFLNIYWHLNVYIQYIECTDHISVTLTDKCSAVSCFFFVYSALFCVLGTNISAAGICLLLSKVPHQSIYSVLPFSVEKLSLDLSPTLFVFADAFFSVFYQCEPITHNKILSFLSDRYL